jgi:hypothetical protein
VTVLPSLAYFIGQGIMQFFRIPLKKSLCLIIFFMILTVSAFYEIRTYFVYQKAVFETAFEIAPNKLIEHIEGKSLVK